METTHNMTVEEASRFKNQEFISVELLMNYITAERTTAQKKYAGGRSYGRSVAYGYAVALYKMSEFIENNKISIGEKE